jgi:uncharacterized protein YbjT (DUF2867 family)
MILVAGATGELGRAICRKLTERGARSTAWCAHSAPAAVAELEAMGVITGAGRPGRPGVAARGLQRLRLGGLGHDRDGPARREHRAGRPRRAAGAGAAAAEEGVERFVYVSYSGVIGKDDPLTLAKRAVERTLKHSGMTWTVLRPSYFMESWFSPALGFDVAAGTPRIYGAGPRTDQLGGARRRGRVRRRGRRQRGSAQRDARDRRARGDRAARRRRGVRVRVGPALEVDHGRRGRACAPSSPRPPRRMSAA